MDDLIGIRGLCKACKHSISEGKEVICNNKLSQFYGLQVNSVLCTPCFESDKSKGNIKVEKVSFGS